MNRRDFLRSTALASGTLVAPNCDWSFAEGAAAQGWRTFEVTTQVEVLKAAGTTRIWLPAALVCETAFQKTLANEFKAEGGGTKLVESKADALGIVAAEFPAGVKPVLTLTSRIATKDYAIDFAKRGVAGNADTAELEHFLRPTKLMPTDGIVKVTADEITKGATTDVEKARARLFGSWEMNWIAYNFAHDVSLPGSSAAPVAFFMYPQAETSEDRLDCLDPDGFKYEIKSRESAVANG